MALDGHVRVLPTHVANKIAAGEVVERPASAAKELVENAIDAGARRIQISIDEGGKKAIIVRDNGTGMTKEDALVALERQATSKIADVDDIERIATLGFRGEALPSIASVSRFTITTRRHDADEGFRLQVECGRLVAQLSAGCPPGTSVEVRDLFCNIPARRKFLRSVATEESHIRQLFTIHALAHPEVAFSLVVDGREVYSLSAATNLTDRIRELFGNEFLERTLPIPTLQDLPIKVSGRIEKPSLDIITRRDQYVFINGRPATAPTIGYALKEALPGGDKGSKPAAILFLEMDPAMVDVNVHPTKREVRFRNNAMVKTAIVTAISKALTSQPLMAQTNKPTPPSTALDFAPQNNLSTIVPMAPAPVASNATNPASIPQNPEPVQIEFPVNGNETQPWAWFKFLAATESGYLLLETDAGIVTVNPQAARERVTFERFLGRNGNQMATQNLLIPEMLRFTPTEAARIRQALPTLTNMGFVIEEFGSDTFKVDAVPQILEAGAIAGALATVAKDLTENRLRSGEHWREELIARSLARSQTGRAGPIDETGAMRLIEDLAATRMPYVSPRGKPIMIFTSAKELERRFAL